MKKFLLPFLFLSFLFFAPAPVPAFAQAPCDSSVAIGGGLGSGTTFSWSGNLLTISTPDFANEYGTFIYIVNFSGSPVKVRYVSSSLGSGSNSNPVYGIYENETGGTLYSSYSPPSTEQYYGAERGVLQLYGASLSAGSVTYEVTCLIDATPTPTLTPTVTPSPTITPSPVATSPSPVCFPFTSGSLVAGDYDLIHNAGDGQVFTWSNSEIGFNTPDAIEGPFTLSYSGELSGVSVEYNLNQAIDINGVFPAEAYYISMSASGGASLDSLWACQSDVVPTPVSTPLATATINATAVASVTPGPTATIIPTAIGGGGSGGSGGGGWSIPTPMPLGGTFSYNNQGALEFLSFFITFLYATQLYWPIVTTVLILLAIGIVMFIVKHS